MVRYNFPKFKEDQIVQQVSMSPYLYFSNDVIVSINVKQNDIIYLSGNADSDCEFVTTWQSSEKPPSEIFSSSSRNLDLKY